MLDHVPYGVPPVIKDLRTQDMKANDPHAPIVPLGEPLVAQALRVEVVDLERRVMRMGTLSGIGREKEGVVIHRLGPAVLVHEGGHYHRLAKIGSCRIGTWNV